VGCPHELKNSSGESRGDAATVFWGILVETAAVVWPTLRATEFKNIPPGYAGRTRRRHESA